MANETVVPIPVNALEFQGADPNVGSLRTIIANLQGQISRQSTYTAEYWGASPTAAPGVNVSAIQNALSFGGAVTISAPGTYSINSWPTAPASAVLQIAGGVTISDGTNSVSGPLTLRGGMWPNGRVFLSAASIANGSTLLTVTGANFTANDLNKRVWIGDATTSVAIGNRINSIVSATQVNIATASGVASITNGHFVVGIDNSTAIQAVNDAVAVLGGTVNIPPGIMCIGIKITQSGGVLFQGAGSDYGVVTEPSRRGSVLLGTRSDQNSVITMGSDSGEFHSGYTIAELRDISVDGGNVVTNALIIFSRRCKVENCQIWRGANIALYSPGQNARIVNNIIGQDNNGTCVYITAGDTKFFFNEVRECGTSGYSVLLENCANTQLIGNHWYKGSTAAAGGNLRIVASSADSDGNVVVGNSFDGVYGNQIEIETTGAFRINHTTIVGNHFFQVANYPDNTYSILRLIAAAGGSIRFLSFDSNVSKTQNSSTNYKAMVEASGAGSFSHIGVTNNKAQNCNLLFSGITPDNGLDNNSISIGASFTVLRSSNKGAAAGVTDGATISHGLATTPVSVRAVGSVASQFVSVTAVGSTTFTVAIKTDAGGAGSSQTVYWDASL